MLIAHIDDDERVLNNTARLLQAYRSEVELLKNQADDEASQRDGAGADETALELKRWARLGLAREIDPAKLDIEVALSGAQFWENVRARCADGRPLPQLILLDLKLNGLDEQSGLEVLESVKHSEELVNVPVVMFTTHVDENSVKESYLRGANGYVGKGGFDYKSRFLELITHWVGTSELPIPDPAGT